LNIFFESRGFEAFSDSIRLNFKDFSFYLQ